MPFVLFIIGAILLTASIRNTQGTLFDLIESEFTGQGNFIYWVISLLVVGAIGYIPKLKPFSIAFLTLVIMVLILTKGNPNSAGGGFFAQFTNAIKQTTTVQSATAAPAAKTTSQLLQLPALTELLEL